MTAVVPEKHLVLANGDLHPIPVQAPKRARAAYRPRSNREMKTALDQLTVLRAEGWTPATLALAGPEVAAAALTAASTRVETKNSQDLRRLIQPWQARALTYYDMIGEVNFSSQFYSRTLAKVRLFPAILDENGDPQESTDPTLVELWNRVQDPGGGRSELQASYGRLMFITGEGYLTCTPDPDWGEVWEFLSPDELRVQPGGIYTRYRAPQIGTQEYVNAPDLALEPAEGAGTAPDEIIAYRLWKKHPRYSWWADSSMHAVLDILEELLLLTLAVRSQAKSRAANNGILLWPNEMALPQLDSQGDEDPLNDPFFETFEESWVAPIANPGAADAGVPLLVMMAADLIAEVNGGPRFLKFDANDAYAENTMRTELIRRFAMSVDLPPEQLLGMADVNHWSGWLIDEQTWKAHLMPVTQQMCNDFNSAYLRPAAREEGFADWKHVVIGYDATEVINHPDRGKDAKDLFDDGELSGEAYRDAKGFEEDDAPDEAERARYVGIKTRDSSLAWFGIPSIRPGGLEPTPGEIESTAGNDSVSAGPATGAEVEPGPPPAGEPDPREPVTAAALNAARIIGAAEVAVDRCRELAGAKIVTRVRNAKCADCLAQINGVAPALVASALGIETLVSLGTPSPSELVAGGARSFVASAPRFGLNGHAGELGELIEQHAAATLALAEPPELPQAFHDLLKRITS